MKIKINNKITRFIGTMFFLSFILSFALTTGQAQESIEDNVGENLNDETESLTNGVDNQSRNAVASVWTNPVTGVVYANSNVKLILESQDDLSQVSHIEYRIDGGKFNRYTAPISILEEGSRNIIYRAIDLAGNSESLRSYSITIDNTPPQISVHPAKVFASVNDRFYSGNGNSFAIKALDELSGVSSIQYGINEAPNTIYKKGTNIILSGEGVKLISCKATDNLGHENKMNMLVEIDNIAPTVAIQASNSLINVGDKDFAQKSTSFSVKSLDSGSGLASIFVRVDGSPNWDEYTNPIFFEEETEHTIEAKAIDVVGNESEVVILQVTIDELPPTSKLRLEGVQIAPSNE